MRDSGLPVLYWAHTGAVCIKLSLSPILTIFSTTQLYSCPWDVWTGCFAGTGFVLGKPPWNACWTNAMTNCAPGMSQHIWIVPDIEIHPSSRPRKTYTDIISLAQHDVGKRPDCYFEVF